MAKGGKGKKVGSANGTMAETIATLQWKIGYDCSEEHAQQALAMLTEAGFDWQQTPLRFIDPQLWGQVLNAMAALRG